MMSEQKHTAEPWGCSDTSPSFNALIGPDGFNIFDYTRDDNGLHFKPEDARRIVACVNACAGIPTEDLEKLTAIDKVQLHGRANEARLFDQRDKLLAALKQIAEYPKTRSDEVGPTGTRAFARAIIAEIEAAK